jgi:adenylosuccinate synthase
MGGLNVYRCERNLRGTEMPVSVVVGGQYGSEGKGKIALEIARRSSVPAVVVRVGGSNSGHTGYDSSGRRWALRQIPAAALAGSPLIVLPAGSYIDVDVLLSEVAALGVTPDRLVVDSEARLVTAAHKAWEAQSGLSGGIGSTGSGTGAAVLAAIARNALQLGLESPRAADEPRLAPYLGDAVSVLRERLSRGHRVVLEGTQGFGLSPLHGGVWPKATSRDTTAAGFLSETGLSPFDVDDITLVIRCHPIRVSGASGPLEGETSWDNIARQAGADRDLTEHTTVTGRIRRVGLFNAGLVRRAIATNRPTRIVLNHLDYVDWSVRRGALSERAKAFVSSVTGDIGAELNWVGISEKDVLEISTASRDAKRAADA